jgi:hypothetical protein
MPHDDVLDPRYLEVLIEALKANPKAVVSYSDLDYFDLKGDNQPLSYDLKVPSGHDKTRTVSMLRKSAPRSRRSTHPVCRGLRLLSRKIQSHGCPFRDHRGIQ